MDYYQADVYENVRFNAFIPNGGNLKYEAGEFDNELLEIFT